MEDLVSKTHATVNEPEKTGTIFTTSLLFCTSAFGMGMMLLPAAFNCLGYVLSLAIMLSLGALLYASLYFLNAADESEKKTGEHDYSYFAAKISPKFKIGVSISFICSNFVVVYLFLRRATDLSVSVINLMFNFKNITWFRFSLLTFYAIMSCLLFLQKDLSVLKPFSYVSLGAAIYYSVLMVIMGCGSKVKFRELKAFNFYNGINATVNIIFAAHCQFSYLSFKRLLRTQNTSTGNKLAMGGTAMIYAIYITVGFFGYMYLGSAVDTQYILGHYLENPKDNALFKMNNVFPEKVYKGMIVTLVALFAVIFFTNVPLTVFTFLPEIQTLCAQAGFKARREYVGVVVALLVYAAAIPRKLPEGLFLTLSAAFFTNFLSFGFPGIYGAYYCQSKREKFVGALLYFFSAVVLIAQLTYLVYCYSKYGKME
ncbi:transmembrane amino acid transporter [Ecytonucleospora hepatopenaei]|uniref:Transmembrane amino acid transporter n=1 Tax=Ecytonucleospora hepatopenaei TaxID=646526 RepID=A0A1W0E2W8_9MICR|nr:transmembrane amino acid transporter [Ecytonucleospora hepatopenaei]